MRGAAVNSSRPLAEWSPGCTYIADQIFDVTLVMFADGTFTSLIS